MTELSLPQLLVNTTFTKPALASQQLSNSTPDSTLVIVSIYFFLSYKTNGELFIDDHPSRGNATYESRQCYACGGDQCQKTASGSSSIRGSSKLCYFSYYYLRVPGMQFRPHHHRYLVLAVILLLELDNSYSHLPSPQNGKT